MHNIALTWQQAAALAAVLLAVAGGMYASAAPRARSIVPYAREAGVISALYALWQLAGTLSVLGTSRAFERADWIVRVEHDWHLPSEASVQRLVDAHPLIVQGCNLYYASMHFGALFVFLPWLFLRHREHYARVRLSLVLVTLVCLLVQLIPVAPPRLLPGFVDTAQRYGQSVYASGLAPDQLSAMPSVHVAWAVLIGWAVVRVSSSRRRWLALAHPILTIFVITATANHFWLDGVVAVVLLAACVWAQRGVTRVLARRRNRSDAPNELSSPSMARILR
ncbi:MAG: hypothetical protein QOH14_2040 [Pseudonocardiales bacterium]|nr:hypothetical protein [Pseudonocardiales bacterium]